MEKYYREKQGDKVPVNKIIPFSAVDGPGNRTAIFLQGCNIDCKYCHNPETRKLCIGCGNCVTICPTGALTLVNENEVVYHKDKCIQCDMCIAACKNDASPKIEMRNPREVFSDIKKQRPFISGVTISGGECMLYPEFIEELFGYCKGAGLTTLIDSNGMVAFRNYQNLLLVTDGVMLDIKAFNKEDSILVVGYDNEQVLDNAIYLAQIGKLEEIRTVMVDELFDGSKVIESIGELLKQVIDISNIRYKLIAFRPFGVRDIYKEFQTPTQERMEELKEVALKIGFKEIIII